MRTLRIACLLSALTLLAGCEQESDANRQSAAGPATDENGAGAPLNQPAHTFDYDADWRCLACGHRGKAPAATGPQACPECGKRTYWVCMDYTCRDHGTFPTAIQLDENGDPSHYRVADGTWYSAVTEGDLTNPSCPKCGERMFIQAKTRTGFDFEVGWLCTDCGHTERGKAAIGPKPCPACGKDTFWVCFHAACKEHGDFQVLFQYSPTGQITQVKVADEPWRPLVDEAADRTNMRCPKCGAPLGMPH